MNENNHRLKVHFKHLKFKVDFFDDNNTYFLVITIDKNKNGLYYKPIHTGQYSDINRNKSWNYKIHRLNLCTTAQRKFVDQVKELVFKLIRKKCLLHGLVILHLNLHSIRAIKHLEKRLKKRNTIGRRRTKKKSYFQESKECLK